MEDGSTRELHINKLRPYISRVDHVGVIFDQDSYFGELHYAPTAETPVKTIVTTIWRHIPESSWKSHSVKVTADSSPERLQPYRVPIVLQKEVGRQVNELLDMDLIEHSDSDWAHPVVSYIDDVAVFSETWSDHTQHLEGVFKTLRAVGLTVNLEKCDFGKSQVKFLGHVVGFGKHAPDPQKVETMSKLLRSTTKKTVTRIDWVSKLLP
ncbi:retrovirus-related Pol polyprotein from transposon opus [Trichonephila clavipes]|nr:retrovirus-related Pol polyprotein from transposon opus [Trichonephila clavipes]